MVNKEFVLNNVTVVLIDMQPSFVNNLRPGCANKIIPAQRRVLEISKNCGIPVVVLEVIEKSKEDKTIPELLHVIEKFPREKRDFVYKEEDSGFSNSLFLNTLHHHGTRIVLCMGINAGFCVKATIENAISHDFDVITAQDLIGGAVSHARYVHPADDCIPYFRSIGVGVFSDADRLISILTSQRRVT